MASEASLDQNTTTVSLETNSQNAQEVATMEQNILNLNNKHVRVRKSRAKSLTSSKNEPNGNQQLHFTREDKYLGNRTEEAIQSKDSRAIQEDIRTPRSSSRSKDKENVREQQDTRDESLQQKKRGHYRRKTIRVEEMFDPKAVQAHKNRLYGRKRYARKAELKYQEKLMAGEAQKKQRKVKEPTTDTATQNGSKNGTGRKRGRPRKRMTADDWLNPRAVQLEAQRRRMREIAAMRKKAKEEELARTEKRRAQYRASSKKYREKRKQLCLQEQVEDETSAAVDEELETADATSGPAGSTQTASESPDEVSPTLAVSHMKVFENLREVLVANKSGGRPPASLRQALHTIVTLAVQGPNPVTEGQLAAAFGVSRKYARQALRRGRDVDPFAKPPTKKRSDAGSRKTTKEAGTTDPIQWLMEPQCETDNVVVMNCEDVPTFDQYMGILAKAAAASSAPAENAVNNRN